MLLHSSLAAFKAFSEQIQKKNCGEGNMHDRPSTFQERKTADYAKPIHESNLINNTDHKIVHYHLYITQTSQNNKYEEYIAQHYAILILYHSPI